MAYEERGREQTQMKVLINCCHNFLTHFRISFSLSMKFIQNYLFVFFFLFFFLWNPAFTRQISFKGQQHQQRNKKNTLAQSKRRAYRLLVIPSRVSFSSLHLSILLSQLHCIAPSFNLFLFLFLFRFLVHFPLRNPNIRMEKYQKKLVDVKALSFLVFFV